MISDDLPKDLPSFIGRFGTDAQCRDYLFQARWPAGFRCAGCGHDDAYALKTKLVYECVACRKQHSLLAGHHLRADQDRARQVVSRHLLGDLEQRRDRRHRAAAADGVWQLPDGVELAAQDPPGDGPARPQAAGRPRRGRRDLCRRGQARQAGPWCRRQGAGRRCRRDRPWQGPGRRLGRLRLAVVPNASARSLEAFLGRDVAKPAAVATDGWAGYRALPRAGYAHQPVNLSVPGVTPPCAYRPSTSSSASPSAGSWAPTTARSPPSIFPAYLDEYVFASTAAPPSASATASPASSNRPSRPDRPPTAKSSLPRP